MSRKCPEMDFVSLLKKHLLKDLEKKLTRSPQVSTDAISQGSSLHNSSTTGIKVQFKYRS